MNQKAILVLVLSMGLYLFSICYTVLQKESVQNLNLAYQSSDEDIIQISDENTEALLSEEPAKPRNLTYTFKDQDLAFATLDYLDEFKPVPISYFKSKVNATPHYDVAFLGLELDENYCHHHRAYFVEETYEYFENLNIILEYGFDTFVRKQVIPTIANDIQREVAFHSVGRQKIHALNDNVHAFFTPNSMFVYLHLGLHFSCLTQISNHIPGNHVINRKDYVANHSRIYQEELALKPGCNWKNKYFLKTFLLAEKEDCEAFFNNINSDSYQKAKEAQRLVYIRKIATGVHRGEGVQPMNPEEEARIRQDYENGALCGQVNKEEIVQEFIQNPLLIEGRKFDFRMYMLIASSNPLIAYYHDGYLRVSLEAYDVNSDDKNVLMTNLALNKEVMKDAREGHLYKDMDELELLQRQQWTFNQLETYLLKNKVIKDPNWLDNYLRPELKKAMVHLVKMAKDEFLKTSSAYEFMGVDFMLDEDLNLWFIEVNSGAGFSNYTPEIEKFILKMLQDHFKIVHSLLKSRVKRIVLFINEIIENGTVRMVGEEEFDIQNPEEQRAKFEQITKNYFDPEFEIDADNGFVKIIDENLQGPDVYHGHIPSQCI